MTTDRKFDDEADAMFVDKAREAMRPSVAEDARVEAERRYPELQPNDEILTYPRHALREFRRASFVAGAEWAASRAVPSDQGEERIGRLTYSQITANVLHNAANTVAWHIGRGELANDATAVAAAIRAAGSREEFAVVLTKYAPVPSDHTATTEDAAR